MAHVRIGADAGPVREGAGDRMRPRQAAGPRGGGTAAPRFPHGNLLERIAPRPAAGEVADAKLTASAAAPSTIRPNLTGLPDKLKAGAEGLSGFSLDKVRVSYNSPKPARLQAHAYAQGREIHLAPGQERRLPHEVWHVVQQMQGRAAPTRRVGGVALNEDARLEREADTMGLRSARHSATPTAERLSDEMAPQAVAQCAGHIRFANLSTDAVYQSKGQSVIDGLLATPSIAAFLQNKDALITLESDPQLASVRIIGDQVQISLSPWFFEQESRGRILGMLAHEFGVHPLATEAMTAPEQQQEDQDYNQNTAFATNIPHAPGHTITPRAAGQRDHVFAAVAGQPRFREYRRTVFQMASALVQTAQGPAPGGVTEAHVTDLMMTYLSDLAMILATNDHRMQIITNLARTAEAFNLTRAGWIASLNGANAVEAELIRLTPAAKTGGDVLGEVGSLVGSGALAFTRFWRGPTGGTLSTHAPLGGGVAPTNQIQAQVLADHGLHLVPAAQPRPGLLDALATAGVNNLAPVLQRFNGLAAPDADDRRMKTIVANNQAIYTELTRGEVNTLAWSIDHSLRVLEPSGKMKQSRGYAGALITLVRVLEPTAHYRVA